MPLKPRTRHRPRPSASKFPVRRRHVNPLADESPRKDGELAAAVAVVAAMTVTAMMMVLALGHRDNVCGALFMDFSFRSDSPFVNACCAWSFLSFLPQGEIPLPVAATVTATRPRESVGTDRVPSPCARFAGIRRARTCCCASFPLHASYVCPFLLLVYPDLLTFHFSGAQVREIALDMITDMGNYDAAGLRWQSSAILALQEASEAFLVHLFEDACVSSAATLAAFVLTGYFHPETSVLFTRNE